MTPGGERAIFAHYDYSIRVWDVAENRLVYTLRGHTAKINDLGVSADGRFIISAADDCTIKLWNITSNASAIGGGRSHSSHASRITALTVTPDGNNAISGSVDGVKVWNIGDGMAEQTIAAHDGWVDSIAMRPGGEQLVVLSSHGYGQLRMEITERSDQHNIKSLWEYRWSGVRKVSLYAMHTWHEMRYRVVNLGDMEEYKKLEENDAREITQWGELLTSLPVLMVDEELQGRAKRMRAF